MRLVVLLLLAALIQAAVPTIARSGPAVQPYDLQATAPWMPLLWDGLAVTLPADADASRIRARFGSGADGSDLLALREGHRLTLGGGTLTVAGLAGTWAQTGGVLTIDLPGSAEAVRLVCRQLCYANLGGVRALANRRVGVTVSARVAGAWQDSTELALDVAPTGTDTPPLLRFEPLALVRSVTADLRPVDWYDGRAARSDLRWRVAASSPGIVVAGATAADAWHTIDQFTADAFTITGGTIGAATCTVQLEDGVMQRNVTIDCPVTAPSGELSVIGDFPLSVTSLTNIVLRPSIPGARLTACLPHPSDPSESITCPFGEFVIDEQGRTIGLFIDPALVTEDWAKGIAVFTAGSATFAMPYCIRIVRPPAN